MVLQKLCAVIFSPLLSLYCSLMLPLQSLFCCFLTRASATNLCHLLKKEFAVAFVSEGYIGTFESNIFRNCTSHLITKEKVHGAIQSCLHD